MITLLGFLVLAAVLAAFGDRLSRALGLAPGPAVERVSLGFVIGVGVLTLAVFGLAILHRLTPWTCLAVGAGMLAAGLGTLREGAAAARRADWRSLLWPVSRFDRILSLLIAAFLVPALVMAMAPPTGMDSGVYHFTIPKVILQSQGLVHREDLWIHKSGGFYLVYAFGMALGGEILAKLLAFGFALAGVGLAAAFSERLRPGSGRLAAYLTVSTPLSTGYWGYEYLELPVLTYLLAGAVALVRSFEEHPRRWAFLCCALTGQALSTKPTGFPTAILVPVVLLGLLRRQGARGLPSAAGAALAFLATAGFWSLWNYATTGSLIHRYPETLLDPPSRPSELSIVVGIFRTIGVALTTGVYWTESTGPFIVAGLAGFFLFSWRTERRVAALLCAAGSALYLGVLAVFSPTYLHSDFGARYLAPCLVGFGGAAAAQFASTALGGPPLLHRTVVAALLLPALPLLALKGGKAAVAAPVVLGLESRSQYLAKKIETFKACEQLNALPEPDVRVLFMATRPYYLDRPFVWIPYTGPVPFYRGVASREDFLKRAREQGITHVLLEPSRSEPWMGNPADFFGRPPFRELGRWPFKQEGWVGLYALERP
jgi:hypothetical protein